MRLLNTKTLTLQFFRDRETPPYVALSLVHEGDEIMYADLEEMVMLQRLGREEPYEHLSKRSCSDKLRKRCRVALEAGYDWIWIGLCCIDWSSEVEVNENINMEYERFRNASICFVYLSDVHDMVVNEDRTLVSDRSAIEAFQSSAWFTRSWTVPELLAPTKLRFYNSDWQRLGKRQHLVDLISDTTGIAHHYLLGKDAREASCAEKLSWVSGRKAESDEARVYAALGLFRIKMDISYGEGAEAFARFRRLLLENCDGTVHYTAEALRKAKSTLLKQSGRPDTVVDAFEGLKLHSMLNASLDNNSEWSHIQYLALEMAKHRPHIIDTRYNFTTICRKVRNFFVLWSQATQTVANVEYAICFKVTPVHAFHASPGFPHVSISGFPDGDVFFVRNERLIGFQPCHLYSPIALQGANFGIFGTNAPTTLSVPLAVRPRSSYDLD